MKISILRARVAMGFFFLALTSVASSQAVSYTHLDVYKRQIQGLARFFKRRFLRLYPLHVLALIGFVLVWLTDARTAVKAALGLSMFIPPAPMTLWYVAMIVVCYALAPLLVVPKVIRARCV